MAYGQRQQYHKSDAAPTRGRKPAYRDRDRPKKSSKPKTTAKLTLPVRPDWHAAELPTITTPSESSPIPAVLIEKIHSHAKSLLDTENAAYVATHSQASSSYKFMSTIMVSGTASDKVSALTLVVQESPVHTVKPLENLVGLAAKRSRDQALMALSALKDLLCQGVMLPSDRKLRMFSKQPGLLAALQNARSSWTAGEPLPGELTEGHLIFWAYEDLLKLQYFEMMKTLETWGNDEVEFARIRAVTFIFELLREKPEQEENLLRLLVNKLGDTSRKVASKASHLLLQLQITHPSMKMTIINVIESDILLRTGQSSNAKYYATITLNQTILQIAAPEVANKLLDVYFSLFVTILNRSKHDQPPKEKDDSTNMDDKKEISRKRKRQRINALSDQNQAEQELSDKIIAQVLTGINRAFPFSKKDSLAFETHLNTMYRITHSSNFNTSIQALVLIQQISTSQHLATDRFLRTLYESLLDPRLLKSSKQTMYLNLIYRALKGDVSIRRVKAFVKRLLQIITLHEPAFVCAVLFLVVELQTVFPGVKAMLEQPEEQEEDDEEVFADAPEDGGTAPNEISERAKALAALDAADNKRSTAYDGRKRDPEHSNADRTCLWELSPWLTHYHPSITLFTSYLVSPPLNSTTHKPIAAPPKPDPTSHTLIHFLDRFAYRNPKQKADSSLRGSSIMQPALAASNATDTLVGGGKPLNTEAFWTLKAEDVRPDEVFFHRYFAEIGAKKRNSSTSPTTVSKRKRGDGDDEGDDEDDEYTSADRKIGDEDEIWKALVGSAPELDGGESDEDEEMDDDMDVEDSEGIEGADYDDSSDEGGVDIEGGLDLDELVGGGDEGEVEAGDEEDEERLDDEDEEEEEVEYDDDEGSPAFNLSDEEGSAIFSSDEDESVARKPLLPSTTGGKKARGKENKRRLKDLPTFASAEDYAEMLAGDEDEDYA